MENEERSCNENENRAHCLIYLLSRFGAGEYELRSIEEAGELGSGLRSGGEPKSSEVLVGKFCLGGKCGGGLLQIWRKVWVGGGRLQERSYGVCVAYDQAVIL